MNIIGVIPARYASVRFPGKPLAEIKGKPMIQRVYEQACKCEELDRVIVATDDSRIEACVRKFGGDVAMTSSHHRNGTERCAEIATAYQADYIINIQGDEPFIQPQQLFTLAQILDGETQLGTLAKQIADDSARSNPNVVKVVFNAQMEALYFSRSCIPYVRDQNPSDWAQQHAFYKHIGIYAYRRDILEAIVSLPVSPLEQAESLEQLRWIENGYKIRIAKTDFESVGIDTPQDLERILASIPDI